MNFITLKELKKMVPVASEFKRVPGLKKILEDGIEVILRKQMQSAFQNFLAASCWKRKPHSARLRYLVFRVNSGFRRQ